MDLSQPGEWLEWHRQYEQAGSLAGRLEVVQGAIRQVLDAAPSGPIRILSLCAGDGRDLLGVLERHPRAGDVRACLVENDPTLAANARRSSAVSAQGQIRVLEGDAGITRTYAAAVPVDLLLVCGVFGNVTDADVERTVRSLPQLCSPRGTVIWTRGRFDPDLTPAIRRWFTEAAFEEVAFVPIPNSTATVGVHRLAGAARSLDLGLRLFSFLPFAERPSNRGPPGVTRSRARDGR